VTDDAVQRGVLYQDLATGALCLVDDVTSNGVCLHMTDPPYDQLEMPAALFLTGYARANSA
jgi:hypothetical protein